MPPETKTQNGKNLIFYSIFGMLSLVLMVYYLSNTILHFTTPYQFPISSIERFPLTLLIFPAEIFSFSFAMYFIYNIFTDSYRNKKPEKLQKRSETRVAILIPVYNEPKDIVERTVKSCKSVVWSGGTKIYILDDSSNNVDRNNIEALSKKYECILVRRNDRKGFKAGNINNAVKNIITEKYFVIFDSDQAPEPEFLEETMDYFSDKSISFVQTPQHFINEATPLERAAKLGTNVFYYSQCVSKARDGAMPFCGTNVVVRTDIFKLISGFSYFTSTEDIELGLRMNALGYYGAYVPKILVHGYAPPDFISYSSQQYRWANGNFAILRENWHKILFERFTLRQQIHTLFTLGWWLIGLVSLAYVLVPILSLIVGGTHHTWLPNFLLIALFFNVMIGMGIVYMALNGRTEVDKIKFFDSLLQYSLVTNSMFIYVKAAVNAFFRRYVGFVRTNKIRSKSGWRHIKWNLSLAAICFGFSIYALYNTAIASDLQRVRTYLPISLWLLFYALVLSSSIFFVGDNIKSADQKGQKSGVKS